MDPAIDVIVADLCAAVEELQRHAHALKARTTDLRASVAAGRETAADVKKRLRVETELAGERAAIDLETLDRVLADLHACLESERREIERMTQRQRLVPATERVGAPAVMRVRR